MHTALKIEFTTSLGEYSPYSPADLDAAVEALNASPSGAAVAFHNNRLIRNQARQARVFSSFDDAMAEISRRTVSGLPTFQLYIWCAPTFIP